MSRNEPFYGFLLAALLLADFKILQVFSNETFFMEFIGNKLLS